MQFNKHTELKKIGAYAFSGTGIVNFVAPYHLAEIGPGAFYGCTSLRAALLGFTLRKLGADNMTGVFQNSSIKQVHLSKTLQYVAQNTFADSKLQTVRYPSDATFDIAPYVFGAKVVLYDSQTSGKVGQKAKSPTGNDLPLGVGYYNFYQDNGDDGEWVNGLDDDDYGVEGQFE